MSRRATSPVVAVCLLVVVVVVAVLGVGGLVAGPPGVDRLPEDRSPTLVVSADAAADRVTLLHRGGPAVNVSTVELRVRVDGRPLARHPPVPFFAADGFRAGPTGPFNAAADPVFGPGERASVRIAATNAPRIDPGETVTVSLSRDGERLATVETVAGA